MTSYYAYDQGLPCKNPHCKSVGRPHPSCRCYGDHAEGGDAAFCSASRQHNPDCEYFAEGGEAEAPDFIPDEETQPSAPTPTMHEPTVPAPEGEPDDFIPDDQFVADDEKYSTTGQMIGTAAEGVAQGVLGPLATGAELGLSKLGVPGVSAEDINARQVANPWTHGIGEGAGLAGSMLVGTGEAALASKAAEAAAHMAELSNVGSAFIKGAISNGLIQAGDEVSKWMLGQGNPEDAVGAVQHIGAAALLGGGFGGAGAKIGDLASSRLQKIAEGKLGGKITSYLAGIGTSAKMSGMPEAEREAFDKTIAARYAKGLGPDGGSFETYQKGREFFENLLDKKIAGAAKKAGSTAGQFIGNTVGGPVGAVAGQIAGSAIAKPVASFVEKIAGPAARKYAAPLTFKMLAAGNRPGGMLEVLSHAESMAKGFDKVTRGVDSLFKAGLNAGVSAYGSSKDESTEKDRRKLDDYVSSGGINQDIQDHMYDQNDLGGAPRFAQGGEVKAEKPMQSGLAEHFPDHNIMLSAAKGRISNYLSGLRPPDHQPKLAFDDAPDNRQQKKDYHRALDVANAPLSILNEIKKGTIEPDHVKHLNAMYPELSGLLQRKLTEKITQAQLAGSKPSYKVRQGLSLFMGTALSGEMTPENIQAAQAVFAQKQQAQQPPSSGGKKSSASLTKSDQAYLTGGQSLQKRQQKV